MEEKQTCGWRPLVIFPFLFTNSDLNLLINYSITINYKPLQLADSVVDINNQVTTALSNRDSINAIMTRCKCNRRSYSMYTSTYIILCIDVCITVYYTVYYVLQYSICAYYTYWLSVYCVCILSYNIALYIL
jgi:hypothetical protein